MGWKLPPGFQQRWNPTIRSKGCYYFRERKQHLSAHLKLILVFSADFLSWRGTHISKKWSVCSWFKKAVEIMVIIIRKGRCHARCRVLLFIQQLENARSG